MKIIVLGGSPKGEKSVTMQYVEYLKRRYSNVDFDVRQPAIRIRRLEQDSERFDEIIDAIPSGDKVFLFTTGDFDFNTLSAATLAKLEDFIQRLANGVIFCPIFQQW